MEKLMMDQTSSDGLDPLAITPKYLLCGTAYGVLARQYLNQTIVPEAASNANPYVGLYQPIIAPQISGNKWFLIASPSDIETIEVARLEGENGPVIDSREGFNSDGMEIKCRHTVAVKALEWKGMTYNPGA
jgi:hypothetical protein